MEKHKPHNQTIFSPQITQAVKAKLYEFDGVRVELQKKKKVIIAVFIVIAIIVLGLAFYYKTPALLIAIAVVAMILFGYLGISKSKLTSEFKNEILVNQMNAFDEVDYQPKNSITLQEFYRSGLFRNNSIDRFSGEDLFVGKKDKTAYKFSEILAEEKHTTTDSKGRTRTTWVTIFNGIMMIADFNKNIHSETRVIQRAESYFDNWFNNKTKVKLESTEFEEMFDTYSHDQVEARYILTPAMMERIIKLQKSMNSKVRLSFVGSKVYIAVANSYNFFEADTSKPINPDQLERIFDEIKNCIEIIDILDLNTRIWTKK